MKPAAFDYERPRALDEAIGLLAERPGAKILAGAQTLGPMLNLRLVQPELLVDITRIPELVAARDEEHAVVLGACVTHAAIEDGRAPDPTGGYLRRVAAGIAYRAVRTRGTVGGSLAHADPAADWLSALLATDAVLQIAGPDGRRQAGLADFVRGAMETDLGEAEIIVAIHVPRAAADARLGYHKICRKTGEFADAIAAVHTSEATGLFRMASAGAAGAPILLDDPARLFAEGEPSPDRFDDAMAIAALRQGGAEDDAYELQLRAVAMRRALADAVRP